MLKLSKSQQPRLVGQPMALTVRFVAHAGWLEYGMSWRSFGNLEHRFPFLLRIQQEWLMVLHFTSRQRVIWLWNLWLG